VTALLAARFGTRRRSLVAGFALGLLLCFVVHGGAHAQPAPEPPYTLPDGEGRDLVQFHCAICHDLGIVRQQRLSERIWNEVLNDMKKNGAVFTDEQRAAILDYLAKHFRP